MLQCNCLLIRMTKGFSEVLMNPSQHLFKEQIIELISSRLPIEKEIASHLINREFQRCQMKNRIYFCAISLFSYERKREIVQECLCNLKSEVFDLIPDISDFNERFEEIAATSLNWLKENSVICPRIEKNDKTIDLV